MPVYFFTVPVGKITKSYIPRHIHACDDAYFVNDDNSVTWDSNLVNGKNKIPEELESTAKFPFLIKDKSLDNISGKNNTCTKHDVHKICLTV